MSGQELIVDFPTLKENHNNQTVWNLHLKALLICVLFLNLQLEDKSGKSPKKIAPEVWCRCTPGEMNAIALRQGSLVIQCSKLDRSGAGSYC